MTIHAQFQAYPSSGASRYFNFSENPSAANLDGELIGGGGGEAEPAAYRLRRFSRLTLRSGISPLGTGGEIATNFNPHLDFRAIGHYTNFTYNFPQSGFNIGLNIDFANGGGYVDYYPFHKGFRISPGYLYHNTDRVRADLKAGPGATFTINNIDWHSDDADPVTGTGRLILGGTGPLLTTGWGHIVSRTQKHFSFPFEAGVAFIDTPKASLSIGGKICTPQGNHCEAANNYPGFANNLAIQVADWNNRVAPFHIYPLIQGGVAYTFRIRK
jgi:hypothetical protein